METMTVTAVLKKYFGTRIQPETGSPQTTQEFVAELKALSPTEKRELAELAAKKLGVTLAPEVPR